MYRPKSVQVLQFSGAGYIAAATPEHKLDLPQSTFATDGSGDSPKTPYDNDKYKLAHSKGRLGMPTWGQLRRTAQQHGHALLLLPLLLLVVCLWGLHAHSAYQAQQPRHLIVLDAGSTGTRVHVFAYSPDASSAYAALALPEPKLKVEPGLSSFAEQPEGAAASLQPLLAFAAEHVPAAQWGATRVYLMATAGLRLLPEEQAEAILEACSGALGGSPFLFRREWAAVISGTNEGLYAWVAANYAAGHLQDAADDAAHGRKDLHHEHTFKALLELGGASAQVTFIPQPQQAQQQHGHGHGHGHNAADSKHSVRLKMPGVSHHALWTHSFLGYGFDVVQSKVDALVKQLAVGGGGAAAAAAGSTRLLPLPGGGAAKGSDRSGSGSVASEQRWDQHIDTKRQPLEPAAAAAAATAGDPGGSSASSGSGVLDPCLPSGYQSDDGRVGSGAWGACQALVAQAMDPASCKPLAHTPCPELPASMPKLTGELLAIENFAYTARALALPDVSSLADFAVAARQFCSRPWPQTLQAHADASPQQQRLLWRYCFGSAFAWTLLHQVLHIGEAQLLHFTNALRREDGAELGLDWALGAAVLQLSDSSAEEGADLARQQRRRALLLAAALVGTVVLLAAAAGAWRAGRLGPLQAPAVAPWLLWVVPGGSGGGAAGGAAGVGAKQQQAQAQPGSWGAVMVASAWANAAVSKGGVDGAGAYAITSAPMHVRPP